MATLVISITAQSTTVGRTKTVSGPDLIRFLNAYRTILGQVSNGAGGMRDRTDDEVILGWADATIAKAKSQTRAVENTAAIKAAIAAQTDIAFT